MASKVASVAHRLGALVSSASARNGGEKIIACGSATWGWPLNTNGVQNGDWPSARLRARNWIWGRKCALASHGMVTRPDSQGQQIASAASANRASGGNSGQACKPGGVGSPPPRRESIRDSPPPCGEGLGVGGLPTLEICDSPPPCPSPTRGEGTLWPALSSTPRGWPGPAGARTALWCE